MTAPTMIPAPPRQPGAYPPSPIPPELQNRLRDVFFGEVDFPNIPAAGGASVSLPLQVDSDADILITGGAQWVTTLADLTTRLPEPALFVTLRRTSAGRDLSSAATPLRNVLGTAERPARWETSVLVKAGSTLAVTIRSNHGAALVASLTFWGIKLFT